MRAGPTRTRDPTSVVPRERLRDPSGIWAGSEINIVRRVWVRISARTRPVDRPTCYVILVMGKNNVCHSGERDQEP